MEAGSCAHRGHRLLKAINHAALQPTQKPGRDGWMLGPVPVGNTARDVWGMQLTYHPDDFIHGVLTDYETPGSG